MRALHGDEEAAGAWDDVLDPDRWLWLPGVDYVAGWRAARKEAEEVNALLLACGVERSALRAVADTDAQGHGVVRLVGGPEGRLLLGRLLDLAAAARDDVA
ncbi:hypothetical protein ACIGXM_24340 [Kitasatospora sp. NPDC052896]|uniref:hypothetical protein n=1 Tax=Kitasatospora sp. NPDC052896 TaxID=3364061 RepID=UPI0037CAF4FA